MTLRLVNTYFYNLLQPLTYRQMLTVEKAEYALFHGLVACHRCKRLRSGHKFNEYQRHVCVRGCRHREKRTCIECTVRAFYENPGKSLEVSASGEGKVADRSRQAGRWWRTRRLVPLKSGKGGQPLAWSQRKPFVLPCVNQPVISNARRKLTRWRIHARIIIGSEWETALPEPPFVLPAPASFFLTHSFSSLFE